VSQTQTVIINLRRFTTGDCLFDLKVVTAEGDGGLGQVDLCTTATVTFHS